MKNKTHSKYITVVRFGKKKNRNWDLTIGERIENIKSKGIKKHENRILEFQNVI